MTISLGTIFKLAILLVIAYVAMSAVTGLSNAMDNATSNIQSNHVAVETAASI